MIWRKAIHRETGGFTMIELMITVVVMGVLATLSVPSLQRAYEKSQFRSGHRVVTSALKKARSYAISGKDQFGVHLNAETREITVFQNTADPTNPAFSEGDSVYAVDTLSDDFQYFYTSIENGAIVFRPNGSAVTTGYANIYMAGETDGMLAYFSINVLAATGRVSSYSHYYDW